MYICFKWFLKVWNVWNGILLDKYGFLNIVYIIVVFCLLCIIIILFSSFNFLLDYFILCWMRGRYDIGLVSMVWFLVFLFFIILLLELYLMYFLFFLLVVFFIGVVVVLFFFVGMDILCGIVYCNLYSLNLLNLFNLNFFKIFNFFNWFCVIVSLWSRIFNCLYLMYYFCEMKVIYDINIKKWIRVFLFNFKCLSFRR